MANQKKFDMPLGYKMAAFVAPLPKRGIEEGYKAILNKLRKYSAESIVDVALYILWNPPKEKLEEVRSMPWLTLLLVKWALQDKSVALRVGRSITIADFDQLRQQLWDLHGEQERSRDKLNVWLMLRTMVHVQMEFQRDVNWGFLRWPALYARLDANSRNRQQFRKVIGMEPVEFLDMAFALYAHMLNGAADISPDWLGPFRSIYGDKVDRMYELFVRDLPALRSELQRDTAQKIRGNQELYEFPYLRYFPIVRKRNGRLHVWHRLVLARGLEEAVHLRMSTLEKDYIDSFSRVFEEYVIELAVGSGMQALTEADYKEKVGGHAPSVEVILRGEGCNIFVEAKMGLFADDVLLQDSEVAAFHKTKRLRAAVKQGWSVGALIRDPASGFDPAFNSDQDFLLVVTSRELIVGGGPALQRLYRTGELDYPDEGAKQRMPLSNVFFVSIEEFEKAVGCVAAREIDLATVLKDAAVANQSAGTSRMFFSDFLAGRTQKWALPALLTEARDASLARVREAFGEGVAREDESEALA